MRWSLGKIGKIRGLPSLRARTRKPEGLSLGRTLDDDLPDDLRKAAAEIGEGLARRVHRLRQRGSVGTLPELLAEDWLETRQMDFAKQVQVPEAGAKVDFVLNQIPPLALRIQGEYWHGIHHGQDKGPYDREQKFALEMMGYKVVDVWEGQIYQNRERVMSEAVRGEELLH